MNFRILVFSGLLFAVSTGSVFAGPGGLTKWVRGDVPKSAGCGLGNVIFPKDSWLSTACAGSTNVSSMPSAILSSTSQASGCKGPPSIVQNFREEIIEYVVKNRDEITVNIAAGQGDALDGLANLLDIKNQDRIVWAELLKAQFAEIFPTADTNSLEALTGVVVVSMNKGLLTDHGQLASR